jgi:transcription elongation factor GreA
VRPRPPRDAVDRAESSLFPKLCQSCGMSQRPSASSLLRSLDLLPDGPALWGQRVGSKSPGVFVVEMPTREDVAPIDITTVRTWVERVPGMRLNGEQPTPTQLADHLAAFWLPGQTVVYVGRTNKSLGPRIAALIQTPLGNRRPHGGGHWLHTLRGRDKLRIWWAETDAPEEYEDALVSAVRGSVEPDELAALPDQVTVLPWANLEAVTGERKATGITGSLLADEDLPAGSAASKGASRAGAKSRTTTTRARRSPSATSRASSAASRPVPEPTRLTAAGLTALQKELEELRTVRRPEVILRVKSARELGDLRENADYEAARNEQSFLEGRIQALEQQLRSVVVIPGSTDARVSLGSTVVAEIQGETVEFHLVGSREADPANGRISDMSPVGKALLGREVGDEIVVRTPGHDQSYRIIAVRPYRGS